MALAALHCLAFVDRTMIGGVLPLLRDGIAMSEAQAGWIVGTAFALPYAAAALTLAALGRSRSASPGWLAGGVLLWTLGSVASGLAGSLIELSAARALLGIGQGLFVPLAIARLIDGTPADAQGQALGLFTGSATFGRSGALLVVGWLLIVLMPVAGIGGLAAWRWLFVVTALPNLAALLLLVTTLRRQTPALAGARIAIRPDWNRLLPLFVVAVAPVLLAQAVLGWLPTLFGRLHGLSAREAALLVGGVTLVAAPAGPIIAGWWLGRASAWHGRTPVLVRGLLLATLMPLAGVVWLPSLVGAATSLAVMLLTLGGASLAGLFGIQQHSAPGTRVGVNGIYLAFATLVGVGLGPLLAGMLSGAGGGGGDALGRALLVTGIVAVGLSVLAGVVVQRTAASA